MSLHLLENLMSCKIDRVGEQHCFKSQTELQSSQLKILKCLICKHQPEHPFQGGFQKCAHSRCRVGSHSFHRSWEELILYIFTETVSGKNSHHNCRTLPPISPTPVMQSTKTATFFMDGCPWPSVPSPCDEILCFIYTSYCTPVLQVSNPMAYFQWLVCKFQRNHLLLPLLCCQSSWFRMWITRGRGHGLVFEIAHCVTLNESLFEPQFSLLYN